MAQRKIVWTQTAARQRRSILEYWVNRNKSNTYSIQLLRLSNEKGKAIAQNPKLYRQVDFPDTRMAAMGHFSICQWRKGIASPNQLPIVGCLGSQ